jgi:hypothetical protein
MLFLQTRRFWAILTAVTGALSLAVTLKFTQLSQVVAAKTCFAQGAVVQFELARSQADLLRIFGGPESPCRAPVVAAMDAVNHLDMAAYIPSYTLFAVCAAFWFAQGRTSALPLLAVFAALIAAAGDYVETTALVRLSHMIEAPDARLPQLAIGTWIKWGLLAAHALLLGLAGLTTDPRRRVLGLLLLLPAPGVVAAAIDPQKFAGLMSLGFLAAWLPLLAFAFKDSVWQPKP